jgi:hypothetical protein
MGTMQATSNQYALVVKQSLEEVSLWMNRNMSTSRVGGVRGQRGSNELGTSAGRATGDRADLSGRGVRPGGGGRLLGGGK